jgi:hypothetical protein
MVTVDKMKTMLETTLWPDSTPNHVYFLSNSRDRMFGYVAQGTDQAVRFKEPITFNVRARQFQAVPNVWNFATADVSTKTWSVAGSNGSTHTVSELDKVLSCSCSGFRFRGQCRHVKEIADGQVST